MHEGNKIKVGITGQSGFVGTHLYNTLGLFHDKFERIPFEYNYFNNIELLANFVKKCDVIVHFAAVNRHNDENELYKININLTNKLIAVLTKENVIPHVLFSSSIQENMDNAYGKSKLECRRLFEKWAFEYSASFTGMVIPNVYGPFGLPNYNSFVATFCHKLTHGEEPKIIKDTNVNLIYVGSLCQYIIDDILVVKMSDVPRVKEFFIEPDFTQKVSEILALFKMFQEQYLLQGNIPILSDKNAINLFNTFRSYIDLNQYFPFPLKKNTDDRGTFVETIKLGIGGQVSFSTTRPGITRGNHFHTRKIERFAVIKGIARIQIRKIGTNKIFEYLLDGDTPSYIDMPIWFTHKITNVGTDDLYTQFWINEWYDKENADTFFEDV